MPSAHRGSLLEYLYSDALDPDDLPVNGAHVQLEHLPDAVNFYGELGAWETYEQFSIDQHLTLNPDCRHQANPPPRAHPHNSDTNGNVPSTHGVAPLRSVENGLAQAEPSLQSREEISLEEEKTPSPPPARAATPHSPERPPKQSSNNNEQNIAPPSTPRRPRKKRAVPVEAASPKSAKSHKRQKVSAAQIYAAAPKTQVKEEDKKFIHWSEKEIDLLIHHALDNNGVLAGRVGDTKKLSKHDAKKISDEVFEGKRSAESVRNKFQDLRKTFDWIRELESFTGGGGDPDESQGDADVLSVRISKARRAGKEVGLLTTEKFNLFMSRGWYTSFANVMKDHVGLVRSQVFNSESLSDEDQAALKLDSDSDSEVELIDSTGPAQGTATPAGTIPSSSKAAPSSRGRSQTPAVPVPPHKPKALKSKASLDQIVRANTDRFSTVCDKLVEHLEGLKSAREKHEQALERSLTLKAAQKAVSDPNSSPEFRAAAEKVLMAQFAKMQ
ncbi:hypothetical protein BC629DRAFT_1589683 [Irpex lacteus]|nr:hypothetical protein BC629DRAFT_1589683 [Irpex lacteus]